MTGRERSLILAAVLGLLGAILWGAIRLADARTAAASAAADLAECRRLAAQIEAQRAPGAAALAREPQEAELIRRIESAARIAEFSQSSVERIVPGAAQRVGESDLTEKSTIVELKGVTLRQLFAFLHTLGTGRSSLNLKQIRLSVPSPEDTGDRWSVETTLTYLVRGQTKAGVTQSGVSGQARLD